MELLNISQTHKKHMTDLEIHDKLFRAFKCNFQVSLIQLSNHSLTPLVISRYCKIHKMCSVSKVAEDRFEWVWEACDLGSSWIKRQNFVDLRVVLGSIERISQISTINDKTWISLSLECHSWNFDCLKIVAIAVLSVFSSTYSCDTLF